LAPWESIKFMAKFLVIVESPTKARTISSILGGDYEVISSMGHIADLPATKLGVDVDNGFEPMYRTIPGKQKVISQLKKQAQGKTVIYLATDPDREGETISWHIRNKLEKVAKSFQRVVFHEITKEAIEEAFAAPGEIDMRKVDAGIARRVLDRIVGYSLSPLLWKTLIRGLSAGRVQSIALKFIVEREKEIIAFQPQTTYSIQATCRVGQDNFQAKLTRYKDMKVIFERKEDAENCIDAIKKQAFSVTNVATKRIKRTPPPPYITSSLQQDAFNRLRFSAQRTMMSAQKLYEGVQIGSQSVGLITYMRTDSFYVNPKKKKETQGFIIKTYGQEYLAQQQYQHKQKKGAQLAHEAIRPTCIFREASHITQYLSDDELRLYELIWRRFVASLMKEAVYENTKATIASQECEFIAEGRKIVFDGFLKALGLEPRQNYLPELSQGQTVVFEKFEVLEHTTKPPPRYNDASLVRVLEDKGIGRPSTYAPIIDTLVKRNYLRRQKRCFIPTALGIKVSDLLLSKFPEIIDENFTASMEERLDEVANGVIDWHKMLEDFYPSFNQKVVKAIGAATKEIEYSDKHCPKCQGRLVVKWSKKGQFLSCEHFPACRYAESIKTGVFCPQCKQGQLVERRNRRGQHFYGCSEFPECRYTSQSLPEEDNGNDNDNDTESTAEQEDSFT